MTYAQFCEKYGITWDGLRRMLNATAYDTPGHSNRPPSAPDAFINPGVDVMLVAFAEKAIADGSIAAFR